MVKENYPTMLSWPERKWNRRQYPKNRRRRKIRLVDILFNSLKKKHNRKSLEEKFQKNIQLTVKGTENTVTTGTGKINLRNFFSDPIVFQNERMTAPKIGDTITPKNRH